MDQAWPPSNGLGTPTVPLKEAILTTSAKQTINAPASHVWEALRDVSKYPEWNSFCPLVIIHSQLDGAEEADKLNLDTSFTFKVVMDSNKPSKQTEIQLRVNDISTPSQPTTYISQSELESNASYTSDLSKVYRIAWKAEGSFVNRGLRTERFHEIIVLGDNECEVRTWECQGGFLARTVKWFYQSTLTAKFQLWCDDLKKHCEKNVGAQE